MGNVDVKLQVQIFVRFLVFKFQDDKILYIEPVIKKESICLVGCLRLYVYIR